MDSNITPLMRLIASSPATSDWLRQALQDALKRDPLDALKDAECLTAALQQRWDALARQARIGENGR